MTTVTGTAVAHLLDIITNMHNHPQPGWRINNTASGGHTINTPRGRVIVPALLDNTKAAAILDKLRDKGLKEPEPVATNGSRKPRRTAPVQPRLFSDLDATPAAPVTPPETPTLTGRFDTAGKTPPVYPGDPSPDDGEVSVELDITPEFAAELLAREWAAVTSDGRRLKQRPLIEANIVDFVKMIRKDRFHKTHQGLAIGLTGSVYDGQHRLHAIVRCGVTKCIKVTFNTHPDLIEAFDSGRQRRASTKLAMQGLKHASTLAAAARLLYYYLEYEEAAAMGSDAVEVLTRDWRMWHNHTKVGDLEVDEIVRGYDLYPHVLWAVAAKQREPKVNVPAIAVFRYLVLPAGAEGEDLVDTFLLAVVKGIGITTEDHIANAVKRWVERNDKSPEMRRYGREAHLNLLLMAWETYAKGRTQKVISTLRDPFPRAYTPTTDKRRNKKGK